jgi:Ni,Fe-hydrogenase III small subunit
MSGFLLCMSPSMDPLRLSRQRCPSIPRKISRLFLCGGVTRESDTIAQALAKRTPTTAIISLAGVDEQTLEIIDHAWAENAANETVVIIAPSDMLLPIIRSIGTERCKDFLHYSRSLIGEVSIAMNRQGEVQIQFN